MMDGIDSPGKQESTTKDLNAVSGKYVLHTLIAEFTVQVERKVDALRLGFGSESTLSKDLLTKSLQRGEDPQFDQLLSSLGCVAEHCLPSLLDTLFKWYEHQLPNLKKGAALDTSMNDGKQHKSSTKSKSDSVQIQQDERTKCREMAVEFVFCLVLIEVLRQLPVHPLPDKQIRSILTYAFNGFYRSAYQRSSDPTNIRIVADLYAEAIGVLAQTKFQAVRNKFMYELLKDKEAPTSTVLALIMGMKFFRVKMYPIEDFEASFRFLQELANYSLDVKNREIKHALAGLFVEILVPVAAAVKTEVNVPVLRDFVDSLYPTSLELSKRQKNKLAMYPLVTCLLCVSQKQFFLNNWHIFLDTCLSTLKNRDQKLSRVALESLYRLLWVYVVRIKCESNTATQSRLQSIVKGLFPVSSRNVVPKDTPLNIFVKIIQFIAQERLDFAMKEIILDLLSISLSSSRSTKPVNIHPERMNIGLRAFLVITDSLQQKDGAPPMPSTVGVMPSGNTLRVKKTFLNKTLTEDEARTIGVSHYHKHVQKALNGILLSLDGQVGQRMMMTNSQLTNKDPQDLLTGDNKPKIELFRTCVAAIPRLMPTGMSHSDLLDMLSRLTVHVDEELRGRAFSALQSFAVDFPTLREEVVATFLSFILKQVSDAHQVLLDSSLKMLASLITAWKNNASNLKTNNAPRWLAQAVKLLPTQVHHMTAPLRSTTVEWQHRDRRRKGWMSASQKRWWSKERRQFVYSSIMEDVKVCRKNNTFSRCRHKGMNNSNFPNNSSSVNLTNGRCVYAPIINRVEGFALVLLCSSRSGTRRLACHILKEIRSLAQCVEYGKQDDELCLDILDRLCPEVARDVIIRQNELHQLSLSEIDNVLAVAAREDMTSLVECSCSWHDNEGLHPWIVFMATFIEPYRLPKLCPSAVAFSWPDVYIRLSQIQQHIEPAMALGNKKMVPAPAGNDQDLVLWTNYLVFACKCAPSDASVKMKQTKESAIAAGTPDWQVALTRDSERLTALPSSLFQRLITQLRADGSPAYREAVVIGLGSTSVVAFFDLMNELLTIIHEATEVKKQENPRRKRKRDHVRAVLAKVFARLATHRVLSEGILAEPDRPRSTSNSVNCKKIVQDYIDEMRLFLDQENSTANVSQTSTSFVGSVSGVLSPSLSLTSSGSITDLRLYFAEMVIQLIRHFPLNQRSKLLTAETRKQLFMLYGSWCGKIGSDTALDHQTDAGEKVSDVYVLLYTALRAECAVLCCGPVFDRNGFGKNGYLFQWLEKLLDCPNQRVHRIGWEAVVLLLHYNSNITELLSWLIDKCYTGTPLLATGCFLGIATQFANSSYDCDCISMLSLALFKLGDHDPQVAQTAENFLVILLSRYFRPAHTPGDSAKNVPSPTKKEGFLKPSTDPGELQFLSQAQTSEELARSYPEISLPVLSELFSRFPSTNQVGRRQMLEFMKPWLQNIELVCLAPTSSCGGLSDSIFGRDVDISTLKSRSSHGRSWLPGSGWGSSEATLHVLNNLMYITTCYHQNLGAELERCWVTLCEVWPANLLATLQYLMALHSVRINDQLSRAAKLVISYLARDNCTRVIQFIVSDCQVAQPVTTVVEQCEQPPYYKVIDLKPGTKTVDAHTLEGNDHVDATKRASSADNVGKATSKEDTKLHSISAPATQADRYQSTPHENQSSVLAAGVPSNVSFSSSSVPSHKARDVQSHSPATSPFIGANRPSRMITPIHSSTLPQYPLSSTLSPRRSRHVLPNAGHVSALNDKNQQHYMSLQQLHEVARDDELSSAKLKQTLSMSPPPSTDRFRGKGGSRKLRGSNMASMPSVLSSSMFSLNTNSETGIAPGSKSNTGRFSSPPARLNKFRHSTHEPLMASPVPKLQQKFSSTKELSTSSTSERADPPRPNILSEQKSLLVENNRSSKNSGAAEQQLEKLILWRAKVEGSMNPDPLPMPHGGVMLPLHEFISFEKVGLHRSSVACALLSELVLWHGITIDWQTHLPVILLSLILNMDLESTSGVPFACQQLLAHIILKLCPSFVPSQVACSVISCKLDSSSHCLVSKPISKLIRSVSVEKLSKATTPSNISGISFPRDSGISSPSSPPLTLRGARHIIENDEPVSSASDRSSGIEMGEPGLVGEHAPDIACAEYSASTLLRQLVGSSVLQWNREDVTPKSMVIKSAEHLTSFVEQTVKLLDAQLPSYKVRERLGKESLNFFITTVSKHHANRSLQVFRALKLPLPTDLLADLVGCLLGCVADGGDPEAQSLFIEILYTLLHACDLPPDGKDDDESRKRSRSFTPDRSWRLSADGTNPPIDPRVASPLSTMSSVPPSQKQGKIASQIAGLSVLPNKPKFTVSSQSGPFDNTPGSPKNTGARSPEPSPPVTTRPFKKGHAHRRSGSVTLTKKMAEEVTQSSQRGLSESGLRSPPLTRHTQSEAGGDIKKSSTEFKMEEDRNKMSAVASAPNTPRPSVIQKTQSADPMCSHRESHSESGVSNVGSYGLPLNSLEEWKNMLAQLFWIGVAILESDYEHEFLLAVRLIEKVLSHLRLVEKDARFRIEKYLGQIKWGSFLGLQNHLLKGLTSTTTCDSSFRLLSSLTTVSHLSLVSGELNQGNGFSMNVIALLPYLVDRFGDPDPSCLESAQNIAQVCVEDYQEKKKLQSLAHVMSLYSNQTYGKPCLTWVSVVCKYVHETFPDTIRQQLTFLLDVLEKGHASTHQSCLRIIYSLLSLSEMLSTTASNDVAFSQDLLRAISKFINNTKLWKEALNILKLAVSRSSAIAVPSDSGIIPTSSSLSGDMDRLELPGRTLTFEYDVKDTPIVGKLKPNTDASKSNPSVSLSYHTSTTSPPSSGWKRPHLSQRRTHERILFILPICGQHIPNQSKSATGMLSPEAHISTHMPDLSLSSTQTEEELLSEENVFDQGEEAEDDQSLTEQESGVDDTYVLRNFDFLDDIEDTEDRFMMMHHNSSTGLPELELGVTEEDPDTCNLTPMHREASMEIDPNIIPEEDEESDREQSVLTVPEKCLESEESSVSQTSSAHSIPCTANGSISNGEVDFSNKLIINNDSPRKEIKKTTSSPKPDENFSDTIILESASMENIGSHPLNNTSGLSLSSRSEPSLLSEARKPSGELDVDVRYRVLSSEGSCSDDENSDSLGKNSYEELSEAVSGTDSLSNAKHKPLHRVYSDIPHTPPPPPSNINSNPVDIPIVSPPPPPDDLISNASSVRSEPVAFELPSTTTPIRQAASDWSFSRTSSPSVHGSTSSLTRRKEKPAPEKTFLTPSRSVSSLYQPEEHLRRTHGKVSSFSAADVLLNPPPWNAPSPFPPEMHSRWQNHIESMTTDEGESMVLKTFDLFPVLYRVLCYDFSKLSKDGCKHLGSQLSKIAEHFSSMVEQLPSQIQCPTCLATKGTVSPVLEQLKFGVLELQEHLDSYNTKRKNTLQCLDMVKELKSRHARKTSAADDSESLAHKNEEDVETDECSSSSSSHSSLASPPALTNPAMLKCQLELCRLLYKLHFQLLLLLKGFNKLIQLVTASSPDNKNITEEMNMLRKKLLSVENLFQDQDRSSGDEKETISDVKSLTRDEAAKALAGSISNGNVYGAIEQLVALRELWPPDVFGSRGDCASDCLTKIYFKYLEDKSSGKFYAVLGPDDVAHNMCEKLMEVNSQIRHSLRSLAVIPPSDVGSRDTQKDEKPSTTKRTLL